MFAFLHAARVELAEIHPGLPAIAIAVLVGAVVWLWRRYHAQSFEALPRKIQALPAVVLSGLLAAAANGLDPIPVLVDAIGAALAAIGGHHGLAKFLLPQGPSPKPATPPATLLLLLVLPLAIGCGGATQVEIKHAAECATLDEFYAAAAAEIVGTGVCDSVERVEQCVPYAALEELYVQSAKAHGCTS